MDDVSVLDHYVTTTSNVIIWFKTEEPIATEIYCLSPHIRSEEIKVRTFIPYMARARRQFLVKLSMANKKATIITSHS